MPSVGVVDGETQQTASIHWRRHVVNTYAVFLRLPSLIQKHHKFQGAKFNRQFFSLFFFFFHQRGEKKTIRQKLTSKAAQKMMFALKKMQTTGSRAGSSAELFFKTSFFPSSLRKKAQGKKIRRVDCKKFVSNTRQYQIFFPFFFSFLFKVSRRVQATRKVPDWSILPASGMMQQVWQVYYGYVISNRFYTTHVM